jgi:hypothetical protein
MRRPGGGEGALGRRGRLAVRDREGADDDGLGEHLTGFDPEGIHRLDIAASRFHQVPIAQSVCSCICSRGAGARRWMAHHLPVAESPGGRTAPQPSAATAHRVASDPGTILFLLETRLHPMYVASILVEGLPGG